MSDFPQVRSTIDPLAWQLDTSYPLTDDELAPPVVMLCGELSHFAATPTGYAQAILAEAGRAGNLFEVVIYHKQVLARSQHMGRAREFLNELAKMINMWHIEDQALASMPHGPY
jgi:hypothetical protein